MKKNYILSKLSLIALSILFALQLQAQTKTVHSLEELLTFLAEDSVDIKLAPGIYEITPEDITAETFSNPLFLFEGSHSTYDFEDAIINIETEVLRSFGNVDVNQVQILGNENVLNNLTIEDIGTAHPTKRAQSIVVDGRDNRIEGLHLTVRGSYPYGYGDAFGKGGGAVINHQKHSAVLIRGLRNHLKGATIISRSYGHCVFMQAASFPLIEDCYIEGEMRTTDDMLAETSGPAFDVDFMTAWGYKLPPGYMMSLQEAGIRAYNAGRTYIDGVEILRGTDNPTVINCTMKNTRTGVTLAHATGRRYVENCVAIGCESGFSVGSGIVINCAADAIYGPVYKNAYASDRRFDADITILPPSDEYYNGHKAVAYVGGTEHNLTFRSEETDFPSDLKIMLGGDLQGLRVLNGSNPSQNNHTVESIFLKNMTDLPVLVHGDASKNRVQECNTDDVVNDGSGNNIEAIDCNSENLALTGAAVQSSTDFFGLANRAIDGNTDGVLGNGSATFTRTTDPDAWWRVNLSEEKNIGSIVVWNRTESQFNIDRLANFEVKVYDAAAVETFSKTFTNDPPNPSKTIDTDGVMGSTVKIIQLNNSFALSLAEVQVYEAASSVEESTSSSVRVYPNPVVGEVNISLSQSIFNIQETSITIYDIKGRKVKQVMKPSSDEIKVNISDLNKGVYIIRVSDNENTVTEKVIKF